MRRFLKDYAEGKKPGGERGMVYNHKTKQWEMRTVGAEQDGDQIYDLKQSDIDVFGRSGG